MKTVCETLKNIRKRIAEANYIETELAKLQQAKQPVNIVGLAKDMLPSPTPFKQAITAATMTAAIAFTALPIDAVAQNADTKKDEKQDTIAESGKGSTHVVFRRAGPTLIPEESKPLYVIDGEPITESDFYNNLVIKPEEIKSIEILINSSKKDSTATCYNSSANRDIIQLTLNKKGRKKLKKFLKERERAKKKE